MSQPMSPEPVATPIFYPASDGQPMAETEVHLREMMALIDVLTWHFRDDPRVHVSGNNFLYYEAGVPTSVVSPDVYVVKGVPKQTRRIFKLWEEDAAPCFVMEVSSRSTWLEDHGNKRAVYAMLGVADYFLFDPEGLALDPPLQGYRLGDDGEYRRLEADDSGVLVVATLGLELCLDDESRLHVRDQATGKEVARSEEVRRDHEALTQERDALAARVAELEAKLGSR